MFAILAEDRSDAESLVTIVRRLIGTRNQSIRSKGFSGCGELCRKAGSQIQILAKKGATHFIICHDSDGNEPREIKAKVEAAIREKVRDDHDCCIVVPIQEIEAWMIADEHAIRRVIPTLSIKAVSNPESVESPKEWLIGESRKGRSRPLYVPTIHNPRVAEYIDLDVLAKKCPAFQPLKQFVSSI
jgi:hypothetical protein